MVPRKDIIVIDPISMQAPAGGSRRRRSTISGAAVAALGALLIGGAAFAQEPAPAPVAPAASQWDKTFPKSDRVDHRKVSFTNRLGIRIVADLYVPRDLDRSVR